MKRGTSSAIRFSGILFALAAAGISTSAFCKEVYLFDCVRKRLVPDYESLVEKMSRGDRLALCLNGAKIKWVTLDDWIGSGTRNQVYSLLDDRDAVLRLPLRARDTDSITETLLGDEVLESIGTARTRVLSGQAGLWALAERLPRGDFETFEKFRKTAYPSESFRRRLRKLEAFALRNATLLDIGDLTEENLVFSKSRDEWLVIDWANEGTEVWDGRALPRDEQHPLHYFAQFKDSHPEVRDALRRIEESVAQARKDFYSASLSDRRLSFRAWVRARLKKLDCATSLHPL